MNRRSSQEDFEQDKEDMMAGIGGLLGGEGWPEPEKAKPECTNHIPDGHNYDDPNDPHPIFLTCKCVRCDMHFTINKQTGLVIPGM